MSDSKVFALYRRMLTISSEMFVAANQEEWDKLIVLEQERSELVGELQTSSGLVPDSEEDRQVLVKLIHEIQGYDEKIKPMIVTWMAELRSMFESAGNEFKLEKQYGAF
jgi:flagellar protein FliT